MASDSDLEAYLNQLSRKTNILKQDIDAHNYISSHPTSPEDKSTDTPGLSGKNEAHISGKSQNIGNLVTTSDITALSEKYGRQTSKKVLPQDEFHNIEKKYSSKKKITSEFASSEDRRRVKDPKRYGNRRESNSYESSVDEELARYLIESSLSDTEEKEKKYENGARSVSAGSSVQDLSDDVLNLNNIITMEDIVGHLSEDSDSSKIEQNRAEAEIGQDVDYNSDREELVMQNQMAEGSSSARNKSDNGSSFSNDNPSGNTEVFKNLMRKSSVSLFYPGSAVEEDDRNVDKLEGVLFTEVPDNVFHSSRRNSLIVPVLSRKSSVKSLVSLSVHDQAKDNGIDSSNHSSAESVIEKLSIPCESSVAESVAEKDSNSNVVSKYSEDFEGSSIETLSGNEIAGYLAVEKKNFSKSFAKGNSIKKVDSNTSLGNLSSTGVKDISHKDEKEYYEEVVLHAPNSPCSDGEYSVTRAHSNSYRQKARQSRNPHEKLKQKDRKEERIRASSSSSSCSTSSSSSRRSRKRSRRKYRYRSSSSSSVSWRTKHYEDAYRKYEKRRYKYRSRYIPVEVGPYMYPFWGVHNQQQVPLAAAGTFPHPRQMEGWGSVSGFVGVDDILRQQVALTRQFMESQKALYHAYTATLTSSYRYTSLKDTEKYIKKKKHPITFDEAYRLVKEEMKSSSKSD